MDAARAFTTAKAQVILYKLSYRTVNLICEVENLKIIYYLIEQKYRLPFYRYPLYWNPLEHTLELNW